MQRELNYCPYVCDVFKIASSCIPTRPCNLVTTASIRILFETISPLLPPLEAWKDLIVGSVAFSEGKSYELFALLNVGVGQRR